MSDISNWIQDNWFEMGSLIAQFAIVAVLLWYARTSLRLRSASEHQAELTPALPETSPAFAPAEPTPAGHGGVGRMLSPMPEDAALEAEPAPRRRAPRTNPLLAVVKWLQEPMGTPSRRLAKPI